MPSISLSRRSALAVALLLLVALALAGRQLARTGTARAPAAAAPLESVGSSPASRRLLVVHVVGAVRRAGLYRLPDGSRVADAVGRAGGASLRADLSAINLAAPLVDGIQVLVPRRAEAVDGARDSGGRSSAGSSAAGTGALGTKLSLSSATAEEL